MIRRAEKNQTARLDSMRAAIRRPRLASYNVGQTAVYDTSCAGRTRELAEERDRCLSDSDMALRAPSSHTGPKKM